MLQALIAAQPDPMMQHLRTAPDSSAMMVSNLKAVIPVEVPYKTIGCDGHGHPVRS
jgi:hypothetical protein